MKNNKKGNELISAIMLIILIVLIILGIETVTIKNEAVYYSSQIVTSNDGTTWGKYGEGNDFVKLAFDVYTQTHKFLSMENPTKFLNTTYNYGNFRQWTNLSREDDPTGAATNYPSGYCTYHAQSGPVAGNYVISNVIDINRDVNKPGITIYGGTEFEEKNKQINLTDTNSVKAGNAMARAIAISLSDGSYNSRSTGHMAVSYAYREHFYNIINGNVNTKFFNALKDSSYYKTENGYTEIGLDYKDKYLDETHKGWIDSAYESINNVTLSIEGSNTTSGINYDGTTAYIGPLKINYSGGSTINLSSIEVNNSEAGVSLVLGTYDKTEKKMKYNSVDKTKVNTTKNNYYVKVTNFNESEATIKITSSISSSSLWRGRILVCVAPPGSANNQNALIYAAEPVSSGNASAEKKFERKSTKVSFQKQDAKGNALNIQGIQFEIYAGKKATGTALKTLTTNNKGKTEEIELGVGKYTVKETVNNTYGYKQEAGTTKTFEIKNTDLTQNVKTEPISNTQQLGNLKILKVDEDDNNLKLVNVKFYISTEKGYLQLIGPKGAWEKKYGEATISEDNKATSSQFAIAYVKNKEDATIFKTNNDGIILLNNLEIYKENNSKYTYTIEEKEAGHDYYAKLSKNITVKLTEDETTYVTNSGAKIMGDNDKIEPKLTNKLSYIDLSGKVWLDVPQGKAYTGNNEYDSNDKKLKDIKVILYDTVNKKNIANTKTDENGNYKFTRVSRDNLKNYSVVFEYDGLKYTSVTLANNINETNKSKAKEVWGDNATTEKTRQFVNSKYTNISDNGNAIKTAAGNNIVQASTQEAGDKFNLSKATIDVKAKEIKNIDLGLFTREQPDISITDDITSLIVKVKDSQYIYNYEHIGDAKEEREAKNQTVNLTAKVAKKGKLYASDIKSFQDSVAKMEVYVIYGIQIKNESQTLKTNIKQVNEFYDIEKFDLSSGYSIGSNANNGNLEGANKYKVTEVANANGEPKLNKLEITFNQELKLEPGQKEKIYLKFKLNDETVKGVLNKDVAIYNVATIAKYESNYFEGVDEKGKKIETYEGSGTSRKDKIYAGLDKDSIPNNETIQFEKDGQGNNKLYDMNLKATTDQSKGHAEIDADKLKSKGNFGIDLYEDDAFSAPTFVLYADSVRKIEGTAFEDKSTVNNDNERKGNGKLDNNENKLKDITVELLEAESGNVAKYSDGITEVRAKTDKNGNYTFGKYDTSDPSNIKYLGILPGKYKIRFTYTDGTTKIVENNNEKNVSLLEYKSTIITDENIKTAMENNTRNQRWYLAESVKTGANSIAADDYQKVTELNNLEINNELLNNMNGREMPAYSPMLEIGVEYETIDTMDVEKYEYNNGFTIKEVHTFIDKISNMDFGIVEKPHAVVQAIKRVENIIYQNAKGNTLFYGDPTKDAKIQYVKTYYVNDADKSNGKVEAEIDSDLIQGATLNVIYALKIRNESETDYNTKDYYYYGTKGTEAQKSKINITKVADYMTKDLVFDEQSTNQKNTGAWIKKDLDNNFKKLIDTSIVKTDGYQILMSETYGEIKQNDTAEKYLYATVRTSTSSNTEFINGMEILGYKGGKRIQNTTPGNYNPNNIVNTQNVNPEKDSSFMITVISAPTGKDINYTPYIVIAIVTLTMVAVAIVIIKRKITK